MIKKQLLMQYEEKKWVEINHEPKLRTFCLIMGEFVCVRDTVGSLHTLRLESLKLVFQPLHKLLVNKL